MSYATGAAESLVPNREKTVDDVRLEGNQDR